MFGEEEPDRFSQCIPFIISKVLTVHSPPPLKLLGESCLNSL
jgi:hypothetical protein